LISTNNPRPWTFQIQNGHVSIYDKAGKKIGTMFGPDKVEAATLLVRAVNIYERAQQLRASRVKSNEGSVSET
jgi:hypothetical protein